MNKTAAVGLVLVGVPSGETLVVNPKNGNIPSVVCVKQ
jgi:hypothetical protein